MSNSRNRRLRKREDLRVANISNRTLAKHNLRIDRYLEEDPWALLSLAPPFLRLKRAFRLARCIDEKAMAQPNNSIDLSLELARNKAKLKPGKPGKRKNGPNYLRLRSYLKKGLSVKDIVEKQLMYKTKDMKVCKHVSVNQDVPY